MAGKVKRVLSIAAVVGATLAGAFYVASKIADKNEHLLYPEHPENMGLGNTGLDLPSLLMTQEQKTDVEEETTLDQPLPEAEELTPPEPPQKTGRTVMIGTAELSDDPDHALLKIVADAMEEDPAHLVVFQSENNLPMVLGFASREDRGPDTLNTIYFVASDGSVTQPSAAEKDHVLAFGRTILQENEEVQEFLRTTE